MWDSNGGKEEAWDAELMDCKLGFEVGAYEGAVGGGGGAAAAGAGSEF